MRLKTFQLTENKMPEDTEVTKVRKPKRVDANGKTMHRLVLVMTDEEKNDILTSVATKTGPLFVKKLLLNKSNDEFLGHAVASVCNDWLKANEPLES